MSLHADSTAATDEKRDAMPKVVVSMFRRAGRVARARLLYSPEMRAHDNHVIGYTVDGPARRITLQTENTYVPEPHPRLDVVFVGVEFYQLGSRIS